MSSSTSSSPVTLTPQTSTNGDQNDNSSLPQNQWHFDFEEFLDAPDDGLPKNITDLAAALKDANCWDGDLERRCKFLMEKEVLKVTMRVQKLEWEQQRREIQGLKEQLSAKKDDIHMMTLAQLQSEIEQQKEIVRQLKLKLEMAETPSKTVTKVSDPGTLEGQQEGAILKIKKQTRLTFDYGFAVGDHVKIGRKSGAAESNVRNIRIGGCARVIEWDSFFPVSRGGKCYCVETGKGIRSCRCVYEDPKDREQAFKVLAVDPIPDPKANNATPIQVNDPDTPEGQIPGAVLKIKGNPSLEQGFVVAGDY